MKQEQVLKAFDCSAEQYKKISDVLAIPLSEDFPAAKISDFGMVLEWFQENKSLSIKSAIARYKELSTSEISPVIDEISPLIDDAAHKIMGSLADVAQAEQSMLCDELRTALRARVYQLSQQPEYKSAFAKFTDGVTVEEVGKPYPELVPENSTALPPGLD
jgi:hypothetical protein